MTSKIINKFNYPNKFRINNIRSKFPVERGSVRAANNSKATIKGKDFIPNIEKNNMTEAELLYYSRMAYDPLFNDEFYNALIEIDKMPFLNKLSNLEKVLLREVLITGQDKEFFATVRGLKPACLISSEGFSLKFLDKIKSDKNFGNNFDFVRITGADDIELTLMLNKIEMLKIIDNNKPIYTSRLNMPANTSSDAIYNAISDKNKQLLLKNNFDDLLGISLGFPRFSSMIYALENSISDKNLLFSYRTRHKSKYLKRLLNQLYQPNSVLSNLNNDVKVALDKILRSNEKICLHSDKLYQFIPFVQEASEFARISKNEKIFSTLSKDEFLGLK